MVSGISLFARFSFASIVALAGLTACSNRASRPQRSVAAPVGTLAAGEPEASTPSPTATASANGKVPPPPSIATSPAPAEDPARKPSGTGNGEGLDPPTPILNVGARLGVSVSASARALFPDAKIFRGEDELFRPASTMKVFTAMTALADLGESFRFRSQIDWKLAADGTAYDLVVTGGGDPTWVFPRPDDDGKWTKAQLSNSVFRPLVDAFVAYGVKAVRGAIRFRSANPGLDRRGDVAAPNTSHVFYPEGWAEPSKFYDYLRRQDEFGVIPGSFYFPVTRTPSVEWDDGESFIVARFGCSGETATPAQSAYRARFPNVYVDCAKEFALDPELRAVDQNGNVTAFSWDADHERFVYAAAPLAADLRYTFADDYGNDTKRVATKGTPFPSSVVPLLTSDATIRIGEFVSAVITGAGYRYGAAEVASDGPGTQSIQTPIESEKLPALLSAMMKKSINRYAEALVAQIGLHAIERGIVVPDAADAPAVASYAAGMERIRALAVDLAVAGAPRVGTTLPATDVLSLVDGSGLSRSSRITPRLMLQVLGGIASDPVRLSTFLAMAAVTGEAGTLRKFTSPNLTGKIYGKSGTLNDAYHLVGFYKRPDAATPGAIRWTPFAVYGDTSDLRRAGLNAIGQAFSRVRATR